MTPPDLLTNFEVIAEAPNGIQRLRELVLELAVRGKLVEQDPSDGHAVAYVKQIAAEKTVLVKQGRLRNQKASQPILDAEAPFQIPSSWIWLRAEDLFLVVTDGDHQPPPKAEAGVPFLVIGNVSAGKIDFAGTRFVPQTYFDDLDWIKQPIPKDLLYTVTGSYGIVVEVDSIRPFCVQRHIAILKSPACAFAPFLALALKSPNAYAFATTVATGTAQKTVPLNGLRRMPIPVPPLAEQRRIVARVDELMALLDRLEAKRQECEAARAAARDSALAALRDALSPEDVEIEWLRIQERFQKLFARPEDVEPLRQAILELAIRGRLVPQEPSNENAEQALAAAQESFGSEGIRRKGQRSFSASAVHGDELPFTVPTGWIWTRLGTLGKQFDYGTSEKAHSEPFGVPVLRMNNIQNGKVLLEDLKYIEDLKGELQSLLLQRNDLLFNRTNSFELVGKTGVFLGPNGHFTFASYLIRFRLMENAVLPFFANMYMNSSCCRMTQIEPEITQQTGQANFNGTKLKGILFPLPPPEEQLRIVKRTEELLLQLEQLQEAIGRETTLAEAYSRAAVHHLDM